MTIRPHYFGESGPINIKKYTNDEDAEYSHRSLHTCRRICNLKVQCHDGLECSAAQHYRHQIPSPVSYLSTLAATPTVRPIDLRLDRIHEPQAQPLPASTPTSATSPEIHPAIIQLQMTIRATTLANPVPSTSRSIPMMRTQILPPVPTYLPADL